MTEYRVIGKPVPRHDALDKVRGHPIYASDHVVTGMLHGRILRSRYPSARIVSIDTSEAEALPGVVAVLTHRDVPHNDVRMELPGRMAEATAGGVKATQPVLAVDRVRFLGEAVAAVAAETPEAAARALDLIRVEYEETPGVYDRLEAMKPDAPKVHESGNVLCRWRIVHGDVAEGFRQADVVVENTYRTQFVDHAYLETEAGVGWIDDAGVLNMKVGTQVIEHFRDVADVLGLPHNKVRLICAYVGGGFGGKEDVTVEILLGLLVWKTRLPIRLVFSREESIIGHGKRHPYLMRYKTGVKRTGEITALQAELISDAGAYAALSPWVLLYSTVTAQGPYRIPNVLVEAATVYTNNTWTSAMRCFGTVQSCFAYESQMDAVARAIGMDPREFRERNYLKRGDAIGTGQVIETDPLLVETARRAWEGLGPRRAGEGSKRIGRGLASSFTPYGRMCWTRDSASAWVGMELDGTVAIRCGVPDIGGGQLSSLCSIAAEVLGVRPDDVTAFIGDSHLTPLAGTTTATRQLYMSGNAVLQAAREVRAHLAEQAAAMLHAVIEKVTVAGGVVFSTENPSDQIPMAQVVKAAAAEGRPIQALAKFNAPTGETIDPHTGQGKPFPDYTYGTQAAEVEVDEETGKVRVRRLVSCYDVGRAVNKNSVEGQLQGGAVMGIGYALLEEVVLEEGVTRNAHLADYRTPCVLDVPEVETILIESGQGLGPFGAKGVGEPSLTPTAAAIANAVADAIGVRVNDLPMVAERVYRVIRARGQP